MNELVIVNQFGSRGNYGGMGYRWLGMVLAGGGVTVMKKLIITLVIALAGASFAAHHYYSKYGQQKQDNIDQATEITQLKDTITYQNTHIEMLHALDTQHTQELAHAKSEIDTLRADVAAGRRKLRIKATCPVREATSSGSVVNAATPQLTEPARQDYYRLREMMAENRQQTEYLQDYIKIECQQPLE